MNAPPSTVWPATTSTRSTAPAREARISFCIFMASSTRSRTPASTLSPDRHANLHDASVHQRADFFDPAGRRRVHAAAVVLPPAFSDWDSPRVAGRDDIHALRAARHDPAG